MQNQPGRAMFWIFHVPQEAIGKADYVVVDDLSSVLLSRHQAPSPGTLCLALGIVALGATVVSKAQFSRMDLRRPGPDVLRHKSVLTETKSFVMSARFARELPSLKQAFEKLARWPGSKWTCHNGDTPSPGSVFLHGCTDLCVFLQSARRLDRDSVLQSEYTKQPSGTKRAGQSLREIFDKPPQGRQSMGLGGVKKQPCS